MQLLVVLCSLTLRMLDLLDSQYRSVVLLQCFVSCTSAYVFVAHAAAACQSCSMYTLSLTGTAPVIRTVVHTGAAVRSLMAGGAHYAY
jgi:hypothetical protein